MTKIHKRETFEFYEILNLPSRFGRRIDIAIHPNDHENGLLLLNQGYKLEAEDQPVVVHSRTVCFDDQGNKLGTYGFSAITTRIGFSAPKGEKIRSSG